MTTMTRTRRQSTSTPTPNDPVRQYASDVVKGKALTGRLVRLACERHLADIESGEKRGLRWDVGAALRAIQFFPDVLRLAEGEHAGKPFELRPWQKFIVGSLFGWKDLDGYRRFRNAYVEIGKGNGKSPLAGGVGIYMLMADGEASAECYAAATTREQAGILFQDAVNMVDASPALSSRILKSGNRKVFNLAHIASGSFFRPVSSEGKGLDGKRVHYAALDEVHEHPTPTVVDKMRAGTKGRRQALIFEITNSGFDRNSVCWHHHDYSAKILEKRMKNDGWFAYVAQLDEGDDWRDEAVWPKANPNLGISISLKYLREQVREAVGMPSKQNIVRRLNFCEWTEQADQWIEAAVWDSCNFPVDPEALRGRRCYGGLDLASTNDTASLVLIFPPLTDGGKFEVLPFFWVPEEGARKRAQVDRVSYEVWINQRLITATEGNVIDYGYIRKTIQDLGDLYDIREIAFDRWNAQHIVTELEGDGFLMVKFGQGFESMNAPTKRLMELLLSKQIAHGGNQVLNWMASNVSAKQDPAGNIKPDKSKSSDKIDGIVALIMALARAIVNPNPGSVYDTRGVLTI